MLTHLRLRVWCLSPLGLDTIGGTHEVERPAACPCLCSGGHSGDNGRFRQSTLATSHACARHAQVSLIFLVYKRFWMFFEKPSRPFRHINLRSTVEVWFCEYMGLFFSYAIKYRHLVGASVCARSYFL